MGGGGNPSADVNRAEPPCHVLRVMLGAEADVRKQTHYRAAAPLLNLRPGRQFLLSYAVKLIQLSLVPVCTSASRGTVRRPGQCSGAWRGNERVLQPN